MNTTVIIVTYNSKIAVEKNLTELLKNELIEIIIIDNNSSDDTVKFLSNNFPKINIIKQKENIGFGRAVNKGLKIVKTKYSIVVNPDVNISYQNIIKFIYYAEKNQDTFLFGPVFNNDEYEANAIINVNWISGCVIFINNKFLNDIELFDKNIFLYFEETDLCRRIIKEGLLIKKCKDIIINHFTGTSSKNSHNIEKVKAWHFGWSWAYYHSKHKLISRTSIRKRYFTYALKSFSSLSKTKKNKYYFLSKGVKAYLNNESAFNHLGIPKNFKEKN